jgi:hypothetical protein
MQDNINNKNLSILPTFSKIQNPQELNAVKGFRAKTDSEWLEDPLEKHQAAGRHRIGSKATHPEHSGRSHAGPFTPRPYRLCQI